jgi:cysteine desulfurase family protein (TIGR01976 family)
MVERSLESPNRASDTRATLDLDRIRERFPALRQDAVFLDNPAGTQVAQPVIDRMVRYLTECNANHGGAFAGSRASDAILEEARRACADFLNAPRPEEIVFGPNMTTLTLGLARSLASRLEPGDSIVVTRLDHDANIAPWTQVAEERGASVRWVDFDPGNGTLRLDTLASALAHQPKLVAVGYASNALGTLNPVREIIDMARAAGALTFIDAVHYAPHGPIDVQDVKCDFLAASVYKFFGPHVGILYGRYDLLDELRAYKVRPAPDTPPGKYETGTQSHEGIAGTLGALEYLEWLGETFGTQYAEPYAGRFSGRRLRLKQAMAAIGAYETGLCRALLDCLLVVPGLRLYGLADSGRLAERVPTFSFNLDGWTPRQLAEHLGEAGIRVWDGNYYALAVTERLGLESSGGMVRVGPVHYNTVGEIAHLGELLRAAARGR